MLRPDFFFKIITYSANQANSGGRNICLEIWVDLRTNQREDKDDFATTFEEFVDVVDRLEEIPTKIFLLLFSLK